MSKDLDEALRTWDFYSIAKLSGREEVIMPRQIQVLYTPTKYQIKVRSK